MALTTSPVWIASDWYASMARQATSRNMAALPRSVGKSVALGMAYGAFKYGADYNYASIRKPPSTDKSGVRQVENACRIPIKTKRWDRWAQITEWTREHDIMLEVLPRVPFHSRLNLNHRGAPVSSNTRYVAVNISTGDGTRIVFDEPYHEFPSVEMHARLALTVASGGARQRADTYDAMTYQMDAYMYAMQAVKGRSLVVDPNAPTV